MFVKGLVIAALCAASDLVSKWYAFLLLDLNGQSIQVLPFFNLVKVYNTGISFGMFNDLVESRYIFSATALLITVALCIWLYRITSNYLAYALGFIIGGAFGNVTDRLLFGSVRDFLDFHISGYHWPAFNIADSTIFIGVALILLDSLLYGNKQEKGNDYGKKK